MERTFSELNNLTNDQLQAIPEEEFAAIIDRELLVTRIYEPGEELPTGVRLDPAPPELTAAAQTYWESIRSLTQALSTRYGLVGDEEFSRPSHHAEAFARRMGATYPWLPKLVKEIGYVGGTECGAAFFSMTLCGISS